MAKQQVSRRQKDIARVLRDRKTQPARIPKKVQGKNTPSFPDQRSPQPKTVPDIPDGSSVPARNPLLHDAVLHHQAGRLPDAERLYRTILQPEPRHPDANHNLGVIALQMRKPAVSLPYFKAALESNPDHEQYLLSYMDALIRTGKTDMAGGMLEESRQRGLRGEALDALSKRLEDQSADGWSMMANLFSQGLYDEAEAVARKQTKDDPQSGSGWKRLAMALDLQGRSAEAVDSLRKAVELCPEDAEAHNNLGIVLRKQGRPAEAADHYRRALAVKPDLAEAHNNLGNVLLEQDRLEEAGENYRRALAIKPDYPDACYSLGVVLQKQGRLAEAEAAYRRALAIRPDYADVYNNLGNLLKEEGKLAEAEAGYRRAIALMPEYAEAHSNLGVTLKEQGRFAEAEASYRLALAIRPDYADALNNLGMTLEAQERFAEAEAAYRRALAIKPDYVDTHNNLGNTLKAQGRFAEAGAGYRRALDIAPHCAEAHSNLANILREQGRLMEAEASCRRAIELKPDFTAAFNNLGAVFHEQGRFTEAEVSYRRALAIEPDYVNALNNLGNALQEQGLYTEAENNYRRAIEIKPCYIEAHINLGVVLQEQGRLAEAEASYRRAIEIRPDHTEAQSNLLFAMSLAYANLLFASISTDVPTHSYGLDQARLYGKIAAQKAGAVFSSWLCDAKPKRLRVGFVSGDLRNHPAGYFLEGLITHIDSDRVEMIAYPTHHVEDELTNRLKPHFSAWKPLSWISDETAARLIRLDGIHILLDLSGHTRYNRLPVFAWKPAPVQASWLGYWATTGVREIDYVLADKTGVPEEDRKHFIEKVFYLPDTRLCFLAPSCDLAVAPLPALSNGYVTFGCFQNSAKVTDAVLESWGGILALLPTARLRLQGKSLRDRKVVDQLYERLARFGIDAGRVSMREATIREVYLAAHAEVDLILDTFPYPGGTTTCEALWMGVPTVTLKGDTLLARQGASLLSAAGMTDWIADSRERYLEKAVMFASDWKALAELRASLRDRVLASPLFDARLFARNFEKALWMMWDDGQRDDKNIRKRKRE
jgi:protein O-GlcNAc transferase